MLPLLGGFDEPALPRPPPRPGLLPGASACQGSSIARVGCAGPGKVSPRQRKHPQPRPGPSGWSTRWPIMSSHSRTSASKTAGVDRP
jgi:hypothetical protein